MFRFFKDKTSSDSAILAVLDEATEKFSFPMLDNGYVFSAATRLTAFYGDKVWALVFEIFGFSPRAGQPDLAVYTFGNSIRNRKSASSFVNQSAYENYLQTNKFNESIFYNPIENIDWIDAENCEKTASEGSIVLRGQPMPLPSLAEYSGSGIELTEAYPMVFETCRFFAARHRNTVLATSEERCFNVSKKAKPILTLDDWIHPDIANNEKPSGVESIQQLAKVLATGNTSEYTLHDKGNTHWKNWPDAGTL